MYTKVTQWRSAGLAGGKRPRGARGLMRSYAKWPTHTLMSIPHGQTRLIIIIVTFFIENKDAVEDRDISKTQA